MNSWKFRKYLGTVIVSAMILVVANSKAFALPDQDAQDMLSASQNENDDAVVRWGTPHQKKLVQKEVNPISEESFGNFAAPNVNVGGGRGPASVGNNTAIVVSPANRKLAAKTLVRTLAKQKAYQEVAVIVNDLGFFPSNLFVTQGVPVRLFVTGASKKSQCFMMDSFGIRRQIQNQKVEEITFTPDQTGAFAFSCPMNGAKGTLLVKELDLERVPASVVKAASHQEPEQSDAEEE